MTCPRPHSHEEVGLEIRTQFCLTPEILWPPVPGYLQAGQGQELQQLTSLHKEPASAPPMILSMEERSAASLGRLSSPRAEPLLNSPGGSPSEHQEGT